MTKDRKLLDSILNVIDQTLVDQKLFDDTSNAIDQRLPDDILNAIEIGNKNKLPIVLSNKKIDDSQVLSILKAVEQPFIINLCHNNITDSGAAILAKSSNLYFNLKKYTAAFSMNEENQYNMIFISNNHSISSEFISQYLHSNKNCNDEILKQAPNSFAISVGGPLDSFLVDNLKLTIQKQLSEHDQANNIKSRHIVMHDTNPWYSVDKIDKLLHLKLANNKQISIVHSIEFEEKELLIDNISVAVKEVIDSGKIAVVPLHMHGNHYTALVIKKQTDNILQIIYNDSNGNSLMSEKNSGALIRAISKVNTEFTLIDICLKQQYNDDDCGPYTIENLVKLAITDTSNMHKNQIQKLLQIEDSSNGNDASFIRMQHAIELEQTFINSPICNIKDDMMDLDVEHINTAAGQENCLHEMGFMGIIND